MYRETVCQATFCGIAKKDTACIISGMEKWIEIARKRMTDMGISQDDLCEVLGVKTRGAVGHYLNGRREPTLAQLRALAKKLGMGLAEMLEGDGYAMPAAKALEVNEDGPEVRLIPPRAQAMLDLYLQLDEEGKSSAEEDIKKIKHIKDLEIENAALKNSKKIARVS